ncbi:hypothetical protein D3C86_1181350 [compost metagenome]
MVFVELRRGVLVGTADDFRKGLGACDHVVDVGEGGMGDDKRGIVEFRSAGLPRGLGLVFGRRGGFLFHAFGGVAEGQTGRLVNLAKVVRPLLEGHRGVDSGAQGLRVHRHPVPGQALHLGVVAHLGTAALGLRGGFGTQRPLGGTGVGQGLHGVQGFGRQANVLAIVRDRARFGWGFDRHRRLLGDEETLTR